MKPEISAPIEEFLRALEDNDLTVNDDTISELRHEFDDTFNFEMPESDEPALDENELEPRIADHLAEQIKADFDQRV